MPGSQLFDMRSLSACAATLAIWILFPLCSDRDVAHECEYEIGFTSKADFLWMRSASSAAEAASQLATRSWWRVMTRSTSCRSASASSAAASLAACSRRPCHTSV